MKFLIIIKFIFTNELKEKNIVFPVKKRDKELFNFLDRLN